MPTQIERLEALYQKALAEGTSPLNALLKLDGAFQNGVKPENAATLPTPTPAEYGAAMHWLDSKLQVVGYPQFMANEKLAKERNADWFSTASAAAFVKFIPNYTAERRAIWQAVRKQAK